MPYDARENKVSLVQKESSCLVGHESKVPANKQYFAD